MSSWTSLESQHVKIFSFSQFRVSTNSKFFIFKSSLMLSDGSCLWFDSGANVIGPVFDLGNTIVEYWRKFYYRSVEFAMRQFDSRSSHDATFAFEDLNDSFNFVFAPFHWIIYPPTKFPFFQYSHMFPWPLLSLAPLETSQSFSDDILICLSCFEVFVQIMVALTGWH